jgi:hypothetical protein
MGIDRLEEQKAWKNLTPNQKRGFLALKENYTVIDGKAYSPDGKDISHLIDTTIKMTPERSKGLKAVGDLAKHEEENGKFVFAFFNAKRTMEEQYPALTQSDLARVMFIGTYAAWETGELQHTDNGVPINKKSLEKLLGMSRNKFNTFYKSIVDSVIIAERDGAIFMNPSIFYRGNLKGVQAIAKDMQYTRLFRKTVRDLYAMYNGRSIKQLALVYAVLPFVNFNYNIVSYNPDELNEDKVLPIPLDKLAVLLGYTDHRSLKKALNAIKYDGKPVFGFFETDDRRKRKTVVNPRVIYAGNGKTLAGIRALFN